MDAESLLRGDELGPDNDNLSGAYPYLYYIDSTLCSGVAWPANPADFAAANKVVLGSGGVQITAGDLKRIDVIMHSSMVADEQVGDEGGRAWKHTLEFGKEKNTASNLGFLRASTNGRLIFFVPTPNGIRIVGNDIWPAVRVTSPNTTNKKPDASPAAGSIQTWESFGPGPALILDSTVAALEALLT